MIIKLARILDNEHEASLSGEAKKEYRSMKAGALLGGTTLGMKYLTKINKEINPKAGRVRRFLLERNLLTPKLNDVVSRRVLDVGSGMRMGAIGAIGGGLAGLALHKAIHAYHKKRPS